MAVDLRFSVAGENLAVLFSKPAEDGPFRTEGVFVFSKGDRVVYPHHCAAVIEDLTEREILGERRTYFVLRLAHQDLTLMVPVENTREVGIREVVSKREVKKVFEILREDEETEVSTNWNRR